jgi:hypothetical protein
MILKVVLPILILLWMMVYALRWKLLSKREDDQHGTK